ncbi:hypothetical protein [Halomarina litorea]|uniref:hypothetical protein n=1 Tax=Halomarina litorea TaxID=2961595 RepID=UPI0020C42842|nr:hypothetical protein [Halomarina sp. BCD28]
MSASERVTVPTPTGTRRDAVVVGREFAADIRVAEEIVTVEIDGHRYRVPVSDVCDH